MMGTKCDKPPCRTDAYSGWASKIMGAHITFSFTVPRVSFANAMGCKRKNITRSIENCHTNKWSWWCGSCVGQ